MRVPLDTILAALRARASRYAEVMRSLEDPAVFQNPGRIATLQKERGQLQPFHALLPELEKASSDRQEAEALFAGAATTEEQKEYRALAEAEDARIEELLCRHDRRDDRSATPEYKTNLTVTWSVDALQLQAVGRYIDSMVHGNTVTGGSPLSNTGVDSTYYVDLAAKYDLTENLSLRATVNTVFDEEPQLYSPNVQANTDPSLYDVLGTRSFVGVNYKL